MESGFLFNALISFTLSLISGVVAILFLREARKQKLDLGINFFLILFNLTIIYFFSGLRLAIESFLGDKPGLTILKITWTLVITQMVLITRFIFLKVFKRKKITAIATIISSFFSILIIFLIFQHGFVLISKTYFITKYRFNDTAQLFFIIQNASLVVLYLFFIFRSIADWFKRKIFEDPNSLLLVLVLLVFSVISFIEARVGGWHLVLLRLINFFLPFLVYLIIIKLQDEEN